jgi:hypothetical protein
MPRSREGWLSTIRAISEMTEVNGCTKAEAATAQVKAFELMHKKGIGMRDLIAPVSPRCSESFCVTPESCDPVRRTAYEYWEKHGIRSDPFTRQVFSNETGKKNPLKGIARIVAVCGIAGVAVWAITWVLSPESPGYADLPQTTYSQREINKLAEAHSALPNVLGNRALKPEQIHYSDLSTR